MNEVNMEKINQLKEKADRLPLQSGVYIIKDKTGQIIYIGKAKKLKNRVSQYFRNITAHQRKVYQMVIHANDFDYIVTPSEFEALVLECSLIKQHNPKYNILLKDGKGYHFVRISNEEYPRISLARKKEDDGATYLGPYVSSFAVRQSVDAVNQIFMLPSCNKVFPRDFRKGRPCLNYHIKQCMGVCSGKISRQQYMDNFNDAMKLLKGGSSQDLINELEQRMQILSQNMEFEKAAKIRDQIEGLKKVRQKQNIIFTTAKEQDVIALFQSENDACFSILKIRGGRLVDKADFLMENSGSAAEMMGDFLKRFYYQNPDIPPRIYLNQPADDTQLIIQLIKQASNKNIHIYIPTKGENLKLTEMAANNARESLAIRTEAKNRYFDALEQLQQLLHLPNLPRYIEAYDISNMGNSSVVGGMVVFENGYPLKRAYKRFAIKTVSGQDDYGCMQEVLSRRFTRYQKETEQDKGFRTLPDLILLDGGKGHVNAIKPILEHMGINVPVFGMVKNAKHRTRAIASDGGEIDIAATKQAFSLLTRIQDEVHNYAIAYHRKMHKQQALKLSLTEIDGIGKTRAQALLKHFRTLDKVKDATMEQLAEVKGMSQSAAKAVYTHFHSDN